MPWKTTVEIKVGMKVWFDFMDMETYEDEEGGEYKLVDYASIYAASFTKAPWLTDEEALNLQTSTDGTEYIIPLNGYTLFERVHKKQRGRFDVFETEKVDTKRGIVRYVAKNNRGYEDGETTDHVELEVGDEVQFNTVPEIMLEEKEYCTFDGGRMYRRAQARNIDLVWRNGDLILPKGRVLLKRHWEDKRTKSGIWLPRPNVKTHKGEIIVSSVDEAPVGSFVRYVMNAGRLLDYNGEKHRVVSDKQLLYIE